MTEKEMLKLEEDLNLNEPIPAEYEREFLQGVLETNIREKYKLLAMRQLYKKLHDDERVQKIAKDIKLTKDLISEVEDRLKELGV